jgi:NAD+ diphosphatase
VTGDAADRQGAPQARGGANAFTGARLDRAGDGRRRDGAWLAAQAEDPRARAVLASSEGITMDGDRLARVPLAGAGGATYLLGIDEDGPLFAADLDPGGEYPPKLIAAGGPRGSGVTPPPAADGPRPVPLREAAAVLPQDEGGLVAYVAALLNWHRRHAFCPVCGTHTDVDEGGLVRTCPRCGTSQHPRTDPVVIMLVTDGRERVMLGRGPSWPPRRYSASQPWPSPGSLMLGFDAPWTGGEPAPLEGEIADVRWFSRDELAAAAALDVDGWGGGVDPAPDGGSLLLPPRLAIARRLLEGWLAG